MTTPWYSDAVNFWRFRAIHHPKGLDYVPDRGGFIDGKKTDRRVAFLSSVLDSAPFKTWVREQRPDSDSVFSADSDGMQLRATNNRSYGYTYLWAWEDVVTETNVDSLPSLKAVVSTQRRTDD